MPIENFHYKILQLPDSLPGQGPDNETNQEPSTSTNTTPADRTRSYCTMKHLGEGLVGKIVRYRSGKRKLILGETRFDIDLGLEPGQIQVLITIILYKKKKKMKMT